MSFWIFTTVPSVGAGSNGCLDYIRVSKLKSNIFRGLIWSLKAKIPIYPGRVNQHPRWYLCLFEWRLLVVILCPKMLDLSLEALIKSKHETFVIKLSVKSGD
jgi:hypothetical protein